jgi:hypothetical protein
MSIKHQLQQSIYPILKHNPNGSQETQAARKHILFQIAQELVKGSYKLRHIRGLKLKHVLYLNEKWKNSQLSHATIKNRNAHLRWICEKIHKPSLVPSNQTLGIQHCQHVNNHLNSTKRLI